MRLPLSSPLRPVPEERRFVISGNADAQVRGAVRSLPVWHFVRRLTVRRRSRSPRDPERQSAVAH